jgi:hypothetical protein
MMMKATRDRGVSAILLPLAMPAALAAGGLLSAGCGGDGQVDESTTSPTERGATTQKEAIRAYCDTISLARVSPLPD